ncbi:MAG: DUF4412 domain-containing protein [Bacteroidetes bacterium]|nr:DUF4412 domain-containing protein [Bacteroidota bacterium]MBS1757993.1 DUF4412 domain-containing protein [Bacteroidota bacterium]
MTSKIAMTLLMAATLLSCQSNSSKSGNSQKVDISSSGGGEDTYLEMSMNTKGENIEMAMLQKIYLSHTGKGRVEMYKMNDGKPSLIMIGISDMNKPTQSILIDDSAKTYSINKIDTAKSEDNILDKHTTYAVAKVGNETIQGLNCVHAQIIKTMKFSGIQSFMNSNDTTDLWMTKDIPMPAAMQSKFAKSMGIAYNNDVANQLLQMDCTGFPVKFQMHSEKSSVISNLTKISHDNFSESMFEIPKDYKEIPGF